MRDSFFDVPYTHGQRTPRLGQTIAQKAGRRGTEVSRAAITRPTPGVQRFGARTTLGHGKMIGTFLVFIAAVCAVFRCWWDRLEYYLYKTEIGHSIWVAHTEPQGGPRHQSLFVQYFLRGREFWWWTPTTDIPWGYDAGAAYLLSQSLPRCRGHKVQKACLVTVGDEIDVTKFLQQLSGPHGDFYRSLDEGGQPLLDADTVRAYLGIRLPAQHLPTEKPDTEWLYMTMEVVPGSVPPFKPLVFDFNKPE